MAVTVTAVLLSGGDPQRVQVVVAGMVVGSAYEVRATGDGVDYIVAGGEGTATDAQLVLVDPWAPLNLPVVYSAMVAGVRVEAPPVTVPSVWRAVLASLDGAVVVPVGLGDVGDPREPVVRSVAYPVTGRARPPGRYTSAGDGGTSLLARVAPADVPVAQALLRSGGPVVLRTAGQVPDLPASELLQVVSGPSSRSTLWRTYNLEVLFVDNPDPSVILTAYDWDDFDGIYAASTWDAFDTEWAARTWNAFDREDWGQRL